MEDPFLNYFALGLLFFVVIVLVYGIIAIHDIPARIAHARHHPHQDAIHAAGWISLFVLLVVWPFFWIGAMMDRRDRGWGLADKPGEPASKDEVAELEELRRRMAGIEARLGVEDRAAQLGKGERQPAVGSRASLVSDVEEGVPATEVAAAQSRDAGPEVIHSPTAA